jgi:hypothetical protein
MQNDIRDMFSSPYLKAADLNGDTIATIVKVETVTLGFGRQQKTKPLIWLEGFDKGFVCNAGNADLIADQHGTYDPAKLIGKQITLFPDDHQDDEGEPDARGEVHPDSTTGLSSPASAADDGSPRQWTSAHRDAGGSTDGRREVCEGTGRRIATPRIQRPADRRVHQRALSHDGDQRRV